MSPESLLSKDFCCALITDVKLLSLQHLHFLFPSHSAHSTHTLTAGLRKKKHYGNLFIGCKYIGYYFWSQRACVIVSEIVAWIFMGVISTRRHGLIIDEQSLHFVPPSVLQLQFLFNPDETHSDCINAEFTLSSYHLLTASWATLCPRFCLSGCKKYPKVIL